jgi:hypothetical protein
MHFNTTPAAMWPPVESAARMIFLGSMVSLNRPSCCYTLVTRLLHGCYTGVTLVLHWSHLLSHCSYTVVTLLSHRNTLEELIALIQGHGVRMLRRLCVSILSACCWHVVGMLLACCWYVISTFISML